MSNLPHQRIDAEVQCSRRLSWPQSVRTAVQLLPSHGESLLAELVYGLPDDTRAGRLGPVALFPSDSIVAYRFRSGRRDRLYIFRTLAVDDSMAATIPGVRPRVRLLVHLRSAGRVRLARRLFAYLCKQSIPPERIPDDTYLRIGVALSGRLPRHKILVSLLPPQPRRDFE